MRWDLDKLRSNFRGCFAATACGDAIGLAWEEATVIGDIREGNWKIRTHAEIMEATGGLGVTGLVEIPRTHPVWQAGEQPLGSTSDDWALVGATARAMSLIGERSRPDRKAAIIIARERQITLLQTKGAGWGPGTVVGTQEIGRWLDGHADGRAPWVEVPPVESTGIGKGAGCGPAMQINPLGLIDALSGGTERIDLAAWCRLMAFMTHGNVEATIAAHAMALATSYAVLASTDRAIKESWLNQTEARVIGSITRILTERYGSDGRVVSALRLIAEPGFLEAPDRLREEVRPGFLCWESVPFAIGTWLRHLDDPRGAILEAASAGGDTDSTAAMAGALAGAYAGIDAVPVEWIDQVPNARVAIATADRLFDAVVLKEFNA